MGKIILIVVIIGVGYSWQKGGLREWFKESTTFQREEEYQASSPPPQAEQASAPGASYSPQFQPPSRPDFRQPGVASAGPASECAQVRANVQVMESWMRSGGRVVDVDAKKKLSENDTFSELARHRQYLADNCGGR